MLNHILHSLILVLTTTTNILCLLEEAEDVVGLEQQYVRKLEAARAVPHSHNVNELHDLESHFHPRGQRVQPVAHGHTIGEVADLRPDDAQFIIAQNVFGG